MFQEREHNGEGIEEGMEEFVEIQRPPSRSLVRGFVTSEKGRRPRGPQAEKGGRVPTKEKNKPNGERISPRFISHSSSFL